MHLQPGSLTGISVQVDRDSHRWIHRMETSDMQHKHWRKSAQW